MKLPVEGWPEAAEQGRVGVVRRVVLLALRDLRLEVRDRSGLLSILAFFAVMLFIMALALGPEEEPLRRAAPGVLWVALAFGSTLLSTRAFALEVEEGTLDDLLLAPGGKEWIYFGKLLFQMLLLLPLAALALLMAAGLFYLPLERLFPLFLTLVLGVLGYASVATFYAGLLAPAPGTGGAFAPAPLLLGGPRGPGLGAGHHGPGGGPSRGGDLRLVAASFGL